MPTGQEGNEVDIVPGDLILPTQSSSEEAEAEEVIVTATRLSEAYEVEARITHTDMHLQLYGRDYSFHSAALTPDIWQKVYDLGHDDDGDGTNNFWDKAKGFDDRDIVASSANDQSMLKLDINGREIFRIFDQNGNAFPNQFDKIGENRVFNREVSPGINREDGYYIFKTDSGTEIYLTDAVF